MAKTPIRTQGRPMTETTAACFSDPGADDCFVPGWDSRPAMEQQMSRVKVRAKMGRKKTPTGVGVLRPSRR